MGLFIYRSLGDTMCKIEFDTAQMDSEMITRLESLCNQYIREQRKMYPTLYHDLDDPAAQKVATTTMSSMLTHLCKLHTLFWCNDYFYPYPNCLLGLLSTFFPQYNHFHIKIYSIDTCLLLINIYCTYTVVLQNFFYS